MPALSNEVIAALMGKSRTRNAYGPKLIAFDESDDAGVNPVEAWPLEFGQKKPATLYQGFRTAIEKANLGEKIEVKRSEDSVFLLHKERVAVLMAELNDATATNGN